MTETGLATAKAPQTPQEQSGIVLLGQPNVGKSAMFVALTGRYVTVSNYPGTTVEISRGRTTVQGNPVPVVDTPGVLSFVPTSDDERVARDILLQRAPGAAVAVGDAKELARTLTLALQIIEMELPCVLCLNMNDEATSRGITIDHEALAGLLGVDVIPTVAVREEGVKELQVAVEAPRVGHARVKYPDAIERAITRIIPLIPGAPISPRSLAVMLLAGDRTLVPWLRSRISPATWETIEAARQELEKQLRDPVLYLVNQARLAKAGDLAGRVGSRTGTDRSPRRKLALHLERLTIHPLWSLPVLGGVLYLAYLFVGVFGAGTLVDLLESGLFGVWINPLATRLAENAIPWAFVRDLLVGPYGVITMALTYALALILPIVGTFFVLFGVLEDSGYLPRLAVILHRGFKKMGLNGKAVLPMVLGLGCDTMATLATRILETRKERLIVIILLSLGVPCSAQLTVIMAMLSSVSFAAVAIWLTIVLGVIAVVGALAARVLPGQGSDFIVELPPLRVPRLSNVLLKTVSRIEWYLREAVPLFILGTLILFAADRFGLLEQMRRMAEPIVSGMLGLPRQTAEAFLIGFLRRDFGVAGLYQMTQEGTLDAVQVLVAAVTITLFIPCVAQFLMTVKERGWRTGLAVACFVFACALSLGAALNWMLRVFAVSL